MDKPLVPKVIKKEGDNFFSLLIGAVDKKANFVKTLLKEGKDFISSVKDEIFFEHFSFFILHTYDFDFDNEDFADKNLKSLSIALAEASPNSDADYTGDKEKLREYSKRIIKIIDECATIQKSLYISNLSRAIIHGEIDRNKYFKLCKCVVDLTEEDLDFLKRDIGLEVLNNNNEHIDDFISVGIIYQTEKGYVYNARAFELKAFALCYEENVEIPRSFPPRYVPLTIGVKEGEELLTIKSR